MMGHRLGTVKQNHVKQIHQFINSTIYFRPTNDQMLFKCISDAHALHILRFYIECDKLCFMKNINFVVVYRKQLS